MLKDLIKIANRLDSKLLYKEADIIDRFIFKHSNEYDLPDYSYVDDKELPLSFKKTYLSEEKDYIIKAKNKSGIVSDLIIDEIIEDILRSAYGMEFVGPYSYKEAYRILALLYTMRKLSIQHRGGPRELKMDPELEKSIAKELMTIPQSEWSKYSKFDEIMVVIPDWGERIKDGKVPEDEEVYMTLNMATGNISFPKGEDAFGRESADLISMREVDFYNDSEYRRSYPETYEIKKLMEKQNRTEEEENRIEELRKSITEDIMARKEEAYKRYIKRHYVPEEITGTPEEEVPVGKDIEGYTGIESYPYSKV